MYCPFCGWDMAAYHVRHPIHKIAYQCDNDVCDHSPAFIAIEVLGKLPENQIIRRCSERKDDSHAPL